MPKNLLAKAIHRDNVMAGWWTDLGTGQKLARNKGELIALMHSELSEGYEAWCSETNDDKLPQYDGLAVELADCAIRIYDVLGSMEVDLYGQGVNDLAIKPTTNVETAINSIHCELSMALEGFRKTSDKEGCKHLVYALQDIYTLAYGLDFELDTIITDKREFNRRRADHKPENRVLAEGKKF